MEFLERAIGFLSGLDLLHFGIFVAAVVYLFSTGSVAYTKGKGLKIGNKCASCPKSKRIMSSDEFEPLISFYSEIFKSTDRKALAYIIITKVKDEITRCLVRNHIEWHNDKFMNCYSRETAGIIHQLVRTNVHHECKSNRLDEPQFDELVILLRRIMERSK